MPREIPSTATEIQTGLFQDLIVGRFTTYSNLYSSEGYCFYQNTEEFYDEEGNRIPDEDVLPEQRIYAQFCSTPLTDPDEINAVFVSVPVQPGYEIVSVNKPPQESI